MEKAKVSRKKASKGPSTTSILEAYKQHLLVHGSAPASVYTFCVDLGITENDFYNQYGSFEAVDREIWKNYVTSTIQRLTSDEGFRDFSAREKLLTFYFSLVELLKTDRSYVLLCLHKHTQPVSLPSFLKDFKLSFEVFIESLLREGLERKEIAPRPLLDKTYPTLFWMHMSLLLLYWKDDTSKSFESTDAFIEKSVNLAFELIGKGALDSAIDMMKFLYQSKRRA
jgi:hypothetical protein